MSLLESGKAVEAQACFEQLVQARPAHAAAHHFLGAALYAQHEYKRAVDAMERSLELIEQQPMWRKNLEKAREILASGGHDAPVKE
jgi:cytochrome c-type biogenesis protein CcmH/NrfG